MFITIIMIYFWLIFTVHFRTKKIIYLNYLFISRKFLELGYSSFSWKKQYFLIKQLSFKFFHYAMYNLYINWYLSKLFTFYECGCKIIIVATILVKEINIYKNFFLICSDNFHSFYLNSKFQIHPTVCRLYSIFVFMNNKRKDLAKEANRILFSLANWGQISR